MAVNISNEFHRTSTNPIDDSLTLTKAQMAAISDNIMPNKYFTICQDDGYIYLYDKSATANLTTGKFTKFEGGDTSDCVKFDSNGVIQLYNNVFGDDIIPNGDCVLSLGSSVHRFWRSFAEETHTIAFYQSYNYTYEKSGQTMTDTYESSLCFVPQHNQHYDCELTLHIEGGDFYGSGGVDIKFPDEDGTLALTSDIPDIPLSLEENTTGFSIAGGVTKKTLTVSENYTLGAACAKSVTDNSSSVALTSSDTNLVTGRSVYYHCSNGYAPKAHASTATTYGVGNASNYGHLKLSSSVASTNGESNGVAATPYAVKTAYDLANTANSRIVTGFVMFVLHFNLATGSVSGVSISNIIGTTTAQGNTNGYSVTGSEKPNSSYGLWFKVSQSKIFRGCPIKSSSMAVVQNGTGSQRTSGLMNYQATASQYVCVGAQFDGDFLIIGY